MFKWRRTSNKASYEPKTPKMPSVSLPDDRYTPIESHIAYMEKPRGHTLLRQFTHESRGTTPMLDAWAPHPDIRSRTRTVSTPVRDVRAPRPIRPHPSQGGFMPVMESSDRIRRDHSRGPRVPVGVPSAAFLEDQIRRSRIETQTAPPPSHKIPIDMQHVPGEFPEEFENAESRRLREVARRNGAKLFSHPSKAYLEELNDQQRRENRSRNSLAPSVKKQRSRSLTEAPNVKEVVDFDEWKAVPLETDPYYEPKHVDRNAPLKPALKKTSSLKPTPRPTLKSAMKKSEPINDSKAYHSENESSRGKHEDRMKPIRVVERPSKAFLEEQKEKLEHIKQRGWASRHPSQARPEIRPSAFGHSNSSSTGSPTDSIVYDQHGRPIVRARRPSISEPPISSNYMPAYIKETPSFAPRSIHPMGDISPSHGVLSWPLVEYALRKRDPFPLVTFDAGFNPRDQRYPVKAKRAFHSTALTREEMDIPVVYGIALPEMVIVNKKLHLWPIHLKNSNNWHTLRVIDVFRAIYDTYAQPLTPQELSHFGEDYIHRCQPAFMQRCQDSPQFTHIEERRGLLRIDLLRGRRIFIGLVPIPGRPFHWELLFDDGH